MQPDDKRRKRQRFMGSRCNRGKQQHNILDICHIKGRNVSCLQNWN